MRLTLRTLLAYLDDILDPAQTKEIGARISENGSVSSLVARIRDVMRRRRIGSPELSGPGSSPDPNVVAEYLDNTLDPAAVADLERICLDSDVHLAEVASCHQVLTIVLGEPVTIRPELRERMYAMGSVSPAPAPSTSTSSTAVPAPYAVGSAHPSATRPVVPEYLKRPPLWKKLVPLAAVALVACGWFYLVATGGFFGEEQPKIVASAPPVKKAPAPVAHPTVDRKPAPSAEAPLIAATPMPMPLEEVVPEPAVLPEPDSLPEPTPEPTPMPAEAPQVAELAPRPDPATLPPPPAPGVKAPPPETTPAFDPAKVPTVMYTSMEGVLLHRPRGRQDWTSLPRKALLQPGDELASPEPFVSDLQVSSPADPAISLRISLQGGARIRLLPPTDVMLAEIEIERGRVAVSRLADAVPHAVGLGVTTAGLRTEFDAVSPGTRYGLWVMLPQPKNGPPPEDAWPKPFGTLVVANGSVNVRRANLPSISGDSSIQSLEWTNPAVEDFTPEPNVPDWLVPDVPTLASQKNWALKFEEEFKIDVPVQNQIGPVAETDKRNTIATYSTKTMALIGEVPVLVRVLTSPHVDTRSAAIVGLREWVMISPDHARRLEEEVSRVFRDQEAPIVVKLLWGITDEDARNEEASMQVVEWLNNDNIAIRELAFTEAFRLARRDLGYRPQNPPGQREPAIMRWRELVKRNKGLVPTIAEGAPEPASNQPAEVPNP